MKIKKGFSMVSMVIMFSLFLALFVGCSGNTSTNQKNKKVIGVTLPSFNNKFYTFIIDEMEAFDKERDDIEIIMVDAMNETSKQQTQVENFVTRQVDAIVLAPVNTEDSVEPMIILANDNNIPIIGLNTLFNSVEKATAFVGSESKTPGKLQMKEVAKFLQKREYCYYEWSFGT